MNYIKAPKHFTAPNLLGFLKECEPIFELKNQSVPDYILDLSYVQKCSMLGSLFLFKIIEYCYINKCFVKPQIYFNENDISVIEAFKAYGFWELINKYSRNDKNIDKSYRQLEIKVEDNFIMAPQALIRDNNFSSESLKKSFLPQIEEYYSFDDKVVSMIFTCLSEVLLNFWEHAVEDTKSIIVASGNKKNIEIACADTAKGIISTLRSINGFQGKDDEFVLQQSVKKGVTSKQNSNHMGYGLWILDQIVRLMRGRMHLYSQGVYYQNNFGKVTSGKCGNWSGTIIYLSLPTQNAKTLSDIENYEDKIKLEKLKINWS